MLDSFETLYQNLPQDMDAYYSKEEQANYGVVGIKIALSPSGKTLIYHENSPRETEDCLFFMLSNHSFPDKSRLQMCLPEFSVVHSNAID